MTNGDTMNEKEVHEKNTSYDDDDDDDTKWEGKAISLATGLCSRSTYAPQATWMV